MDDSKSQHLSELLLLCEEKATGTVFMTNKVNHSCQIVLEKGEIKSMAFGQLKGEEVLNSILMMTILRFSFRKDLVLPMPAEALITSSEKILRTLADRKSKKISSVKDTATPKVKSTKPVVMYRGHIVEGKETEEVQGPVVAKMKSKKPLRMYRGQVVHG